MTEQEQEDEHKGEFYCPACKDWFPFADLRKHD